MFYHFDQDDIKAINVSLLDDYYLAMLDELNEDIPFQRGFREGMKRLLTFMEEHCVVDNPRTIIRTLEDEVDETD